MRFVIALFAGIALLFGYALFNFMREFAEPSHSPKRFLKKGRKDRTRKVIVCAGDSHTHGIVGANYVKMLAEQFPDYAFVNAGINGNLAWNVAQRLDDIIACQPNVVTLLIGTNDVNATFSPAWEETYRNQQKITEKPTIDWYRQNIRTIIERLQDETTAQIILLTLPMLGENLESDMNQKISAYNAVLAEITDETGVTLLPLHQHLTHLLSPNSSPPPYEGELDLMTRAIFQHHVLRKSWDSISRKNGFDVLTDHIHLNNKAATVIAELIGGELSNT